MIAALFVMVVAQAPGVSPVRVWISAPPTTTSGGRARVYVQTNTDGHVVVLHSTPDGRVEVLFPTDPTRDPFVRAGTYEVPGPAAAGTAGRGIVLAALSPDPIWFDEFVHRSDWDALSLTGAGAGADPEATLTDIVQRMLGDGSFNYDLVTYTVAPRAIAIADAVVEPTAEPLAEPVAEPEVEATNVVVDEPRVLIIPVRQFPHRRRRSRAAPAAPQPAPPTPAAIAVYSVHRPLLPLPRAVPLVARTRSTAARTDALAARAQLLTRVSRGTPTPSPAAQATEPPARAWVAAVSAPGPVAMSRPVATATVVRVPAAASLPMRARASRAAAPPAVRSTAAQAGPGAVAPAWRQRSTSRLVP